MDNLLLRWRPRVLVTILVILSILVLSYTRLDLISFPTLRPQSNSMASSADDMEASKNHKPSYPHLSRLDPSLLPTAPANGADTPKRLIVIGDVHGHVEALKALLEKAKYSSSTDHVILAGDLVNKGPDSAGVVELVMRIGASAVRGNHEDRVLGAWELAHSHSHSHSLNTSDNDENPESESEGSEDAEDETEQERLQSRKHHKGKDTKKDKKKGKKKNKDKKKKLKGHDKTFKGDYKTARSLSHDQRAWLSALPLILEVGNLGPKYGDVYVVHAGLVPGIPLLAQDAQAVMNMRTLLPSLPISDDQTGTNPVPELQDLEISPDPSGLKQPKIPDFIPTPDRDGVAWAKIWSRFQRAMPKGRRATVVYGHDSKSGLQMRDFAMGLDSGCGKGNELTAVVFEVVGEYKGAGDGDGDGDGDVESSRKKDRAAKIGHRLVSVSCKDVHERDED
ncbi:Metallo-dependent phosphatase [Xylariaceae sp. FL1272]|nr:Metallo-dependent phosphatase [Xylariaceae sp. FL1272]